MSVSCNASTFTGGSSTTYSFSNPSIITLTMDAATGTYLQNFNFPNNNLVIDPDGHASTFSGLFSGTSSQIYVANSQPTGSVTFTNANTFTGTLHIGAASASTPGTVYLSGAGSFANATVIINAALDLSGTASGTSLTNLRSDTGIVAGSVNLGNKPLTLTGGNSYAGTVNGVGGSLELKGSTGNNANQTLTGVNTYTGLTTIDAPITAGKTNKLLLSGSGSIAASSGVANNGTFDISGTTSGTSVTTLSGTGTTTLGSKTLTLTNASSAFSGVIGGTGGLTVSGGSQTLSGNNTYTGATGVGSGGTLNLTGSLTSSVTVSSGGTLSGTGSVGGSHSITNSGTVSPGDGSWGTLTDSGAFTQLATGLLNIDIGGTAASGNYSELNALGGMTLGGTLNIETVNGYTLSGTSGPFDILSAGNGLSGDFSLLMLNGTACTANGTDSWLCGAAEIATEVFGSGTMALNFSPTRVPEPAAGGVLVAGLAGLGWARRRAISRPSAKHRGSSDMLPERPSPPADRSQRAPAKYW